MKTDGVVANVFNLNMLAVMTSGSSGSCGEAVISVRYARRSEIRLRTGSSNGGGGSEFFCALAALFESDMAGESKETRA